MKASKPLRSSFRIATLLAAIAAATAAFAAGGCNKQSEGEPCSVKNDNDDCADGLTCRAGQKGDGSKQYCVCCSPNSTNPACGPEPTPNVSCFDPAVDDRPDSATGSGSTTSSGGASGSGGSGGAAGSGSTTSSGGASGSGGSGGANGAGGSGGMTGMGGSGGR